MANKYNFTYKKRRAWGWGVFLILIAAFLLANQLGGFVELGFWSVLVSAIAVAFIVECFANLTLGSLPIPIAALYYIFQEPLGFPIINLWPTLVLVTLLTTIGLHILLPNRWFHKHKDADVVFGFSHEGDIGDTSEKYKTYDGINAEASVDESGGENNPRISVQFGGISRYLHADALETAHLECNFGSLEVYFDNVTLSPNGADVYISCKFGNIELYVPCEWRVVNDVTASLGNAEVPAVRREKAEDAPVLRLRGNVSLGNMEIHMI